MMHSKNSQFTSCKYDPNYLTCQVAQKKYDVQWLHATNLYKISILSLQYFFTEMLINLEFIEFFVASFVFAPYWQLYLFG